MKEQCSTCAHYECVGDDGDFLEIGYCLLRDLYTFVEDTRYCESYEVDGEVLKDYEAGLYDIRGEYNGREL